MLVAGTYFIRVTGSDDRAQFYSLTTNFAAIPEPGSVLLLCASSFGMLLRRRRK
jgi:PEP-CTERM motif